MLFVFDLDGTLVDSLVDLADSASQMVQSFDGPRLTVTDVADMVGDGAAELVRRALAAAGSPVDPQDGLRRFLEIYDARLLQHTEPYRGVPEMLAQVSRRHALAVLTNKPTEASNRILAGLQLSQYFPRVIGGDGPYPRKPSPEGLLALMAGVRPGDVALIGDSPVDEQAARAAGCHFVYAQYGFGHRRYGSSPPETPFIAERASDLLAVLTRLETVAAGV